MANLTDNIRLNTEVDLNGLINLIQEFKDLNIKVKDVAAASRALTDQVKRDNLQQVNSVKLLALEHDRLTAELINEDKVQEQISKSATARSKKKSAELTTERIERKNSQEDLLQFEVIQQGLNATEISNSNKKAAAENAETAAINKKRTAIKGLNEELLADSVVQRGINATEISESNKKAAAERAVTAEKQKNISITKEGTAVINQGTAATKQDTAEINKASAAKQLEREATKVSTEQQRLYNLELKNKALESKNAQKSSEGLASSLSSLTNLGSSFLAIFGIDTLGSFAKGIIDAQTKVESFDLSMKNLLGSKYGEKLTSDLKQFTVETPLNFEEVIKSASQLVGSFKAAGASSQEIGTQVPQILESLGNSAAALGGDDRLGRLIYAFSQVQATGRLMGTEVRQITETGFPLLSVMAQQTGMKVEELKTKIKDGEVSFEMFQKAILAAGNSGGVFAGSMDIMANTVGGRVDKMKESVFFALANIGNQFNDTAKTVINFGSSLIQSLFGTESAVKSTIDVVSTLVRSWVAYKAVVTGIEVIEKAALILKGRKLIAMEAELVAMKAENAAEIERLTLIRTTRAELGLEVGLIDAKIVSLSTLSGAKLSEARANLAVLQSERAVLIARGESIIAIDAQIAATEALIVTQTGAIGAANKFSASMALTNASAIFITAALVGLYEVYKIVREEQEKANKVNYDWVKANDSNIVSVRESNVRMNLAAEAVMALKEGTDLHKQALADLIKTYPKYFGQLDVEKTKNSQVLAIYDQVNKSIEAKIGLMAREKIAEEATNRMITLRRELIEGGVKSTSVAAYEKENAGTFDLTFNRARLIEYQKLQGILKENDNGLIAERGKNFEIEHKQAQKAYAQQTISYHEYLVMRENLMVKYGIKTVAATISHNTEKEKVEKESLKKAFKMVADTQAERDIFDEIVRVKSLAKTRDHEQRILDLQNEYDKSKINNAIGATVIKTEKLQDIDDKYRIKSAELTSRWDAKQSSAAKAFAEKALQERANNAKEQEVADEIVYVKSLERSRLHETAILDMEYYYNTSKIKNSVGSETKKSAELRALREKYLKDSAELDSKWNADELKATEERDKSLIQLEKSKYQISEKLKMLNLILAAKSSKEIERIEQETADNILISNEKAAQDQLDIEKKKLDTFKEGTLEYIKQHKVVLDSEAKLNDAQEKMADLTSRNKKKRTKEEEELNNKLLKLDEDNVKESVKLEDDKYKLMDKLRILQLISKAKSSEEIIKIQNKENEKILKEEVSSTAKRLAQEKARLVAMAMLGQQNTEEYKKQQGVILKLDGESTAAQIKNAEFLTDKQKEEIGKREENQKKALDFILQTTNYFLDAIDSSLSDSISKTSNFVTKAQLENQRATINFAKQGVSTIVSIGESIAKGDYLGAALKGTSLLIGGIGEVINAKKRLNEAKLENARKAFEDYAKTVSDGVEKIISRIDDIKEAYGGIKLPNGNTLGLSLSKDLELDTTLKYLSDVQAAINQLSKYNFKFAGADLDKLAGLLRISRENLEEIIANNSNSTKSIIASLQAILTYANTTGRSYADLINGVVDAAQNIQKIYESNISNENKLNETNLSNNKKVFDDKIDKLEKVKEESINAENTIYNDKIKSIKDAYDEEVKLINAKFDLEATRANQKYDKETLAILASGSKQLEALITNEDSLNSIRTEFAGKRQFILDSYALANKTITADMSQEEIAGINNAIKARDAALAKLQKWYNDELTAIATSEGQKRKEYTDTEKIRNDINDRLDKAAIVFDAAEIARNANRNVELQKELDKKELLETQAETKKKTAIAKIDSDFKEAKAISDKAFNDANEAEEKRHTEAITSLNKKRDKDIADSYAILTALLEGYSQQISDAIGSSVDKSSEAYQKLIRDLNNINDLLNQIKGNVYTNPLTIPVVNGLVTSAVGFEKGTDDTSVSLKGQRVVDNKGGWQAILHPQEAVFSKADMTQMETVFGKRPTRQEVIENFKIGVVNQVTPQMNPFVIQKVQANGIGNFDKLSGEIRSLAKEVSKKMSPVVYVDKGGIRTYYKNLNSQIEVKNQRFK